MSGITFNKVILEGYVSKEAKEYRTQQGDSSIVRFALATSERYKKRNGDQVDESHFHNVVSFSKFLNAFIIKTARTGNLVRVEGNLKYRTYKNKEDKEVNITEVVIPMYGGSYAIIKDKYDMAQRAAADAEEREPGSDDDKAPADFDDDIPF